MATFQYNALDAGGKTVTGTLEAGSVPEAITKLKGMGYFVTSVGQARGGKKASGEKPGEKAKPAAQKKKKAGGGGGLSFSFGAAKIKPKEMTIITRQLATLIGSGLPLLRALKVLEQQRKGAAATVLARVSQEIEQGALFSEALAKFSGSFPRIYIAMVRAGEAGGALETVLSRLATFMENEAKLKAKIKSAMAYPVLVICAAVGILLFIMLKIVPTFAKIFEDMEAGELPGPTLLLMKISNLLLTKFYLIIIAVVVLVIAYKIAVKIKTTRYLIDALKLKIFLFGPVILKTIIARFSRTFATLITSGVPILQSLQIVRDTVGNDVFAKALNEVRNRVREGEGLSGVMLRTSVFPPMVTNMIAVGEETGAMDAMLEKVADAYDAEVDAAVSAMTSMIEPILIIGLGGIVGFIVISLFMPLIKLAMSLSGGEGG
ncbi:MAG: type II secretion system F family protein [Candidatus Ratteibacteria bacterium]|jgi:type IV pilus assembly protein PilC